MTIKIFFCKDEREKEPLISEVFFCEKYMMTCDRRPVTSKLGHVFHTSHIVSYADTYGSDATDHCGYISRDSRFVVLVVAQMSKTHRQKRNDCAKAFARRNIIYHA